MLLQGCRRSGAAFIKWGQWSATREDIFPEDFCRVLSELHDQAPTHSWEESKVAIEEAFSKSVEQLFESIDHKPIASGSIAQVHRATMHIAGCRRQVAVKVRHPGVAEIIHRDFQVLKPLADATSKVRALKGLSLKESVSQFSHTMTAQADLRVEAAHLRRFYDNFAAVRSSVTPPYPFPGFETESVLIETWEPGESVAKYIRQPSPFNTQIVALGVDCYLKMLLADNFVHTDLHPGNIMVRVRGSDHVDTENKSLNELKSSLQLVLLDFGLAEELTPRVRHHFISFLMHIGGGNGRRAAYHMLHMSRLQQCPNPEAFVTDMEALFKVQAVITGPEGINVDTVLKSVLKLARKHEVGIDSSYAALVLGVCVIVGFATSLDPKVNIMDAAIPCLMQYSLTGRITGRLYS
jgi:aarF domain-containing kinase